MMHCSPSHPPEQLWCCFSPLLAAALMQGVGSQVFLMWPTTGPVPGTGLQVTLQREAPSAHVPSHAAASNFATSAAAALHVSTLHAGSKKVNSVESRGRGQTVLLPSS